MSSHTRAVSQSSRAPTHEELTEEASRLRSSRVEEDLKDLPFFLYQSSGRRRKAGARRG